MLRESMRRLLPAVAFAVVLLAGAPCSDAATPKARAYLDTALTQMRAYSAYQPAEGWAAVTRTVHRRDARASTPRAEYDQLRYVLARLHAAGDGHAAFLTPDVAKLWSANGYLGVDTGSLPKVTFLDKAGRFGLIVLPSIVSGHSTSRAKEYAQIALTDISILQRAHPCGWVIDLRANRGGDLVPMLLAVGPILGTGRAVGFTKGSITNWMSYDHGTLVTPGADYVPSDPIADLAPAPAVAILTGPRTFSAGEAMMLAFRGRLGARSFGTATGGGPAAPALSRLSDGATIVYAVAFMMDRLHAVYRGPILPDVITQLPLQAARRWLAKTPACR